MSMVGHEHVRPQDVMAKFSAALDSIHRITGYIRVAEPRWTSRSLIEFAIGS